MIMMKKQQWMFKQVFSMINSSSSSSSSSISFNNNVLRLRRPFCCSTTTTTTTTPPVSNINNKQHELNMLLEKKLPLLIVPYDHITPREYVLCPPNNSWGDCGNYYVCDGTFGFINLFFHDDDDDHHQQQLIFNKKKKKKKEVYDVYVPQISKRKICGSSEGWLVTAHQNGEFQLLNPVTRAIVHLPPFTTLALYHYPIGYASFINKVVTNTIITTTTNSTTLPAAANTVMLMAIHGDTLTGSLAFCRTSSSTGNGTDETTAAAAAAAAAAWIQIPIKVPMSAGFLYLRVDRTDTDTEERSEIIFTDTVTEERPEIIFTDADTDTDTETEELPIPEIITYEVIDGVTHWVSMLSSWSDVTFYKGNFYTVSNYGIVGVVKGLDGPSPFVQFLIDKPPENQSFDDINNGSHRWPPISYLVESSSSSSSSSSSGGGDLLMVMRNFVDGQETVVLTDKTKEEEEEEDMFERPYRTNGFRVLKLDLNGPSWEEVTDLGEDCALFVGCNHSFSLPASKIPGCRGNCIYFTDHQIHLSYPNGGHDIGVYKLEDASFEKLNYETCSSQLIMPPPVWYVPN